MASKRNLSGGFQLKWRPTLILTLILISSITPLFQIEVEAQSNIHEFNDINIYKSEIDCDTGELKLSAWNNEVELKFRLPTSPTSSNVLSNIVYLNYPGFQVQVFELSKNELREYGGIEFEIYLPFKPPSNSYIFQFPTKGLEFYYQPPLNEETWPKKYIANATHVFDELGELVAYRPIEVVGSYAVYHESKKDNEYKTGKAFHIFRPLLIDSEGNTAWADLTIENDSLRIDLPASFMNTAIYPLIIDPSFGFDEKGGSRTYYSTQNYIVASYFSGPASAVTADSITIFLEQRASSTPTMSTGIYKKIVREAPDWLDGTYNAYTDEWTLTTGWDDWKTFNITDGGSLNASEEWWLCCWSNDPYYYYYDTVTDLKIGSYLVYNYPSWPSGLSGGGIYDDQKISIYCNYTTEAGINYVADLSQSMTQSQSVLTQVDYTTNPSQSLSSSWTALTQWSAIAELAQGLTTSWSVLIQSGFNVITTLSNTFTWVVDVLKGTYYAIDLTQSLTTSYTVLIQTSFINVLTQGISSSWDVLTQWNALTDLTEGISTSWTALTQWSAIAELAQGLTTSWSVLIQSGFNVITSLSNTFTWAVDVIHTTIGGIAHIVDLTQSITTSWSVLTQTSFNIITTLSKTYTWTVDAFIGVQRYADLSISITTSWLVDVVHTEFEGQGSLFGWLLFFPMVLLGLIILLRRG